MKIPRTLGSGSFIRPNAFWTKPERQNSLKTASSDLAKFNRANKELRSISAKADGNKFVVNAIKIRKGYLGTNVFEREIFGIKMQDEYQFRTLFSSNTSYLYILEQQAYKALKKVDINEDKATVDNFVQDKFQEKFRAKTKKLFEKYIEFANIISKNHFDDGISYKKFHEWIANTIMYSVELSSKEYKKRSKSYPKHLYSASQKIAETFEKLSLREDINLTSIPKYYEEKISRDMKCLETAKEIKYKGRICIQPIDIDKDIYFTNGSFEPREHSFFHQNRASFEKLTSLDEKLKQVSQSYIQYIIEKETTPKIKKEAQIDISGGL